MTPFAHDPYRPADARSARRPVLRAALALAGVLVLYTGVDNAFGGVATLGLQGPTELYVVTDPAAFAVRDSHVRFLGGIWGAVGLLFLAGAVWLKPLRPVLIAACGLAAAGGLARFSAFDPALLFGPKLAGPLIAELVVMPLLALWLARSGRG